MAGVLSWNQSQEQDIKRMRQDASDAFAAAVSVALTAEEPDLQAMQVAHQKQSGVAERALDMADRIETDDSDKVADLQPFKDQTEFFSSMRDFVAELEVGIFLYMASSASYKSAVADGMLPVSTASEARKRLQQLHRARGKPHHPASAQFLQSPEACLETVWSDAVDEAGVAPQHYQLLRTMKDKSSSSACCHQPMTIAGARQRLQLPLPQGCDHYKEPLLAILTLLQDWSSVP